MLETAITEVLRKDQITKKIFLGVFARNELPPRPLFPSCFILNTAPRENPGEHWLAFYYDKNGFCDFFDSYGKRPSHFGLESYLNYTSNKWSFNKKRIQGNRPYCGHYALLYLLFRSRGKSLNFFKKFGTRYSKNDQIIKILLI